MRITTKNNTIDKLIKEKKWEKNQPLRLHLGCGQNYLQGYINIDLPAESHPVQNVQADLYEDITNLEFPPETVDEIRNHHVLEHFDRPTALALLIKWSEWLKIGGLLHIETPDLEGCARILSSNAPFQQKQAVTRHLFGSQEAHWAYHLDGWSAEKLFRTLTKFGFEASTKTWQWERYPYLPNVEVIAKKIKSIPRTELINIAKEMLYDYVVEKDFAGEIKMYNVWVDKLNSLLTPHEQKSEEVNEEINKMQMINCLIFSKDRPMQLDAFIRTFFKNCTSQQNLKLKVLYTCSNARFENQYNILKSEYHRVDFIKETNFKKDLINLIQGSQYILFCVDDTVFVRPFSLDEILNSLENHTDCIGFSLRLGANVVYCYPRDKYQRIPEFVEINSKILKFNWTSGEGDFGYPLEVSSSVYRTSDLLNLLVNLSFTKPNTLESELDKSKVFFSKSKQFLLCFNQSVAFSVPANLVQTAWQNRYSRRDDYSPEKLLELFEQGYRIDIEKFQNLTPIACHQEIEFEFKKTKQSKKPLVSVIVPCYNLAQYLQEAVESVVNQTFTDWECIIVNDGSTDNTTEVAREIIAKYPDKRIYLLEKENGGASEARNFGIKNAKGSFILPLDADDAIHPKFLEKTVNILLKNNQVHIVYTDLQEFGIRNNIVKAGDWNPQRLPYQNHLNYCSLYRKEVWDAVGGYNKSTFGYEDWDFWIGCAEKGFSGLRIPQTLFFYRIRENSIFLRAVKRDLELKAKIVLNHPNLYSEIHLIWAKGVISGERWALQIPNYIGIIPPSIPIELLPSHFRSQPNFAHFLISKSPKVTVVIPTFNRPQMLKNAIQSVLNQTFQDFEIIVVNDAGEDVSNVIKYFNDKRIKYFSHSQNKNLAATRNTGIKNAQGTYICYLDDDDFFLPDHLKTLVEFLENNPNYKLVYTDAVRVHQVKIQTEYVNVKQDLPYSKDFDRVELLFGNYIPVLCIMHHKEILDEIGLFDEILTTHEDWDLWIRISRKYPFYHIKKITCAFTWRTDPSSMTSSMREDFKRTKKIIHEKNKPLFHEEIENAISDGNLELAESIAIRMMNIFSPQTHPEPLIDLGVIRALQSRIEEAKQIFNKVIQHHPNNQIAKENLEILNSTTSK